MWLPGPLILSLPPVFVCPVRSAPFLAAASARRGRRVFTRPTKLFREFCLFNAKSCPPPPLLFSSCAHGRHFSLCGKRRLYAGNECGLSEERGRHGRGGRRKCGDRGMKRKEGRNNAARPSPPPAMTACKIALARAILNERYDRAFNNKYIQRLTKRLVQRSAKVFFLGCVTHPLPLEVSHAT